jgi:glycosyltransferase involved in cell wall biosynthesis
MLVFFVGGTSEDQAQFKEKYGFIGNIRLVAHQPHSSMPLWQRAADVLVLPNSGRGMQSREYTSPMKLFEYMASGTPIVASNLPSINAVAGDTVTYAEPDDAAALARAVRLAAASSPEIERKTLQAFEKVSRHTWELRAQRIINFLYVR